MSVQSIDVSVLICAYTEERWEGLLAAVESMRRQTHQPKEVIVIIDHNPTLLSSVRTHIPDVLAIENREMQGLSGARNSGISLASGDILAFMDEDAVAEDDWLEQLVAGYDSEHVLGVGGAILPMWSSERPEWFPKEFDWVVGCTYRGMPEKMAPVRNLIGCNMSFRRHIVDEIGGFRDGIGRVGTLPVGCEETEFCIRANQRWPGSIMRYAPQARVHHNVPASRARWQYFRSRCYFEGRSKAAVANMTGAQDGLSSERTYTLRTLPMGIVRGIAEGVRCAKPAGFLRAGAIIAGLLITTTGYVRGKLSSVSTAPRSEQALSTQEQAPHGQTVHG